VKQPSARTASRNALVGFWFRVQRFLRARKAFAREEGLDAREYELMLMLRALDGRASPNVSVIAENLFVQHHIAAALVKRLAAEGLVSLQRSNADRRSLSVRLTPAGESLLERVVNRSVEGLENEGPEMATALGRILRVDRQASTAVQ
jgi:DNA-binding MarR family transcriptional regulator